MPTAGRSAGRALWVRSLRRATTGTGDGGSSSLSALELADAAAPICLERADRNPDEVELLINAGVYLDESISEPAIASLIQENIGANPEIQPGAGQGTGRCRSADRDRVGAGIRRQPCQPARRHGRTGRLSLGEFAHAHAAAPAIALESARLAGSRIALLVSVGAGITVVAALYRA
jgi:3-oxoacyl-[acyl-carrier-protein] synthase III